MKSIRIAVVVAALGAALASAPPPASAVTITYPGPAPCHRTLQACVNGVAAGSTIQIEEATISSALNINKSLTITRKPLTPGTLTTDGPARPIKIEGHADRRVRVTFSHLRLSNVRFDVRFQEGKNHSFSLFSSDLIAHPDSSGYMVYIDTDVSSSYSIRQNDIKGEGSGIALWDFSNGAEIDLVVQGNWFEATSTPDMEFAIGVMADGGVVDAKIYNNILYGGWGGCGCGLPAAIGLRAQQSSDVKWTVTGNTIDGDGADAYGIFPSFNEPATGVANVFDNIVTDYADHPLRIDTFVANTEINTGFNNFFDNTQPPTYGGYPAGSHTTHDPQFVDEAERNYHLSATSPLINIGSHLVPGSVPRIDAYYEARVEDAIMDIGALEFGNRKGCTIAGTAGADDITGTPHKDVICGDGGGDEIDGARGADRIKGHGGGDSLIGGDGGDRLFGGNGRDDLDGRDGVSGNDVLDGGPRSDTCRADAGDTRRDC